MNSLKRIKIIVLILSTIGFTSLAGCIKPEEWTCLSNKQALYTAWGINAPSLACPYTESDKRKARLFFTDNTSLDILPGIYNNGGVFLQNLNCTASPSSPLLTYILIRWWSTDPKGGTSVATYPIYGCNGATNEVIYLQTIGNGIKKLFTTNREFAYTEAGIRKVKLITSIAFIY